MHSGRDVFFIRCIIESSRTEPRLLYRRSETVLTGPADFPFSIAAVTIAIISLPEMRHSPADGGWNQTECCVPPRVRVAVYSSMEMRVLHQVVSDRTSMFRRTH